MTLTSHYDAGDEKIAVEISIRLIKDVHRTETGYLQVTTTDLFFVCLLNFKNLENCK